MSIAKNPTDWRSNAKKHRIKQLVNTTWLQILELYPETRTAVHIVNIQRKMKFVPHDSEVTKGEQKFRDPYFVSEEEMLKILENYKEELDRDALEALNDEE